MSADTLMAWHAQTLSRVPQRDGGRACCLRRGLPFGAAFANSCCAWPLPIEVLQCLSFSLPCSAGASCVVRHPGPFASQDSLSSKKEDVCCKNVSSFITDETDAKQRPLLHQELHEAGVMSATRSWHARPRIFAQIGNSAALAFASSHAASASKVPAEPLDSSPL